MSEKTSELLMDIAASAMNNLMFITALLLVVLVAACFLGRYVVLTRKLVLSSFGIIAFTIIASIFTSIAGGTELGKDALFLINNALTAVVYIFSFFFFFFAFKEKRILRALESTICFYLLTMYISTFCQLIFVYFKGGTDEIFNDIFFENFGTGPVWVLITAMGLAITLSLFLIVYFGFYKKKKYMIIGIPYRIMFVAWAALFTAFPMVPAAIPSDQFDMDSRYTVISVFFGVGVIILGLAAPVIVMITAAERSLKEKNKSQEVYLSAQLEYIGQYKKQQVETSRFRHDIKNNLALTRMMLDEGHVEEARGHIKDMLGEVSALSPKYVTGDEMLDIIISMKADKMDELNIRFTLDGVVDGGLQMKPMDMCSIFANALDNAIEAASSCEDPFISFAIKRTDKFFVIKITNSAARKIDIGKLLSTSGYTSKSDKDHHGFGLMNVRRAVEDYNGILKADSDEKTFTLSIMMPRA